MDKVSPMNKLPVDCLIPAAGFSSRMGRWKPFLEGPGGRPLWQIATDAARRVCRRVVLVGGYRFEEWERVLPRADDLILLENPAYPRGMLSSIQKGLEAVQGDFFILPVDLPRIGEEHFLRLHRNFRGDVILRPSYRGVPGHPILCPRSCKEAILRVRGERLMPAFRRWEQIDLPWEDSSVVQDMDTPRDWADWLSEIGENNR